MRTLQNKMYKYMTLVSKNLQLDKLDDIINKYNDGYHNTINMKRVDIKSSRYFDSSIENNDKDPK